MESDVKFSAPIWVFTDDRERISPIEYRPDLSIEKQFKLASNVKGLNGVELTYPNEVSENNVDYIRQLSKTYKLDIALISPWLIGEQKWQRGALCASDKKTRKEAIQISKVTCDIAKELGASMVSFWPGVDGYDYPFQVNYLSMYDRFMNAITEIAEYSPDMKLAWEYKLLEPYSMGRLFTGTIGTTMAMIYELKLENFGVIIEVAHAQMALENLAESVCIASRSKKLFHTHFNDSIGLCEPVSLIVGTINFWETLEMLFWLQEVNYNGWYGLDLLLTHEDPVMAVQQSIDNINFMIKLLDKIDKEQIRILLEEGNVIKIQPILRGIFG